jgi:adenine-specific DNA-methyltransferase
MGNTLIHGDNLIGMQYLYDRGDRFQCVYMDPPYNTGKDFKQYKDNMKSDAWLDFMRPRLEKARDLLKDTGSLWVSIDDNESHYLKVLCDEVMGRKNFVANVVWHRKYTISNDTNGFSKQHEHILVYRKSPMWTPNRMPRTEAMGARYKNPDNHPKGAWYGTPLHAKSGNVRYEHTFKNGVRWSPPPIHVCAVFTSDIGTVGRGG